MIPLQHNLDEATKKTTFKLDLEDHFISKNILYYIAGKIKPVDSTKPFDEKSNIRMANNFVAQLFHHTEVKKHNTVIDEIEFTGIASTIKGYVSYSGINEYNGEAFNSGFKVPKNEGPNVEAVGKLGDLGLGFFNDINIPIYKGGFEITFTRNHEGWWGLNGVGSG